MSGITLSQLQGASTVGVRTIGQYYETTRSHYESAERQFDTDVANRIRSGHAWKGEGVANSTMVAETNTSALATSKVLCETAWLALDGFATAISNAQASIKKTLAKASEEYVTVNDDGSAEASMYVDPTFCPEPSTCTTPTPDQYARYARAQEAAKEIEREAKGYLAFATIADQSCNSMLSKLTGLSPITTDEADPGILAYNRNALAGALSTRNLALLTRDFWGHGQAEGGAGRRSRMEHRRHRPRRDRRHRLRGGCTQ